MYSYLILGLAWLLGNSCASTRDDNNMHLMDRELGTQELLGMNPESLPPELWSPSQRKSTASYAFLIAEYSEMQGKLTQAEKNYQVAYNLDPNAFVAVKLVTIKSMMGKLDEAMLHTERLILLYPKNSRLRFLYGNLLFAKNRIFEAVVEFENTLKFNPKFEAAYAPLIEYYLSKNDRIRSIEYGQRYVKHLPWSENSWVQLARTHLILKNYDDAVKSAERAYSIRMDNPEVGLLYALCLELAEKKEKALNVYERVYKSVEVNDNVLTRIIDLYRSQGELENAIRRIDDLLRRDSDKLDKPLIKLHKAYLLDELLQIEQANLIYKQVYESNPSNDRNAFLYAKSLEKLKKFDDAIKVYESIEGSEKIGKEVKERLLVLFEETNKPEQSKDLMEKLISIYKNDENTEEKDLYSRLSTIAADLRKYDLADEYLAKALEFSPKDSDIIFLKGVYKERAGDIEACIALMKRVIELDPKNSSAFNYLGYIYVEEDIKLDEAEKLIQQALIIKPGDGYYLDSLGWLYYKQKKYSRALETLFLANAATPGEGVILEHIADVYWAMENKVDAKYYYQKALKSKFEEKEKRKLIEKLKKYKIYDILST